MVGKVAVSCAMTRARANILRRALRYCSTKVGLVLFFFLLGIAFIGRYLAPYSLTAVQGSPFAEPSWAHPLGLDHLGRDVFSWFLSGGRSVFLLSFAATLLGYAAGLALGMTAGYLRGWGDELLMRAGDVVMAFPPIILVLLLVAGANASPSVLVVGVAITHAPRIARVVRGATAEVVVQQYVEAAEARGEWTAAILVREILPNIWSSVLADFGVRLTRSIILLASLSFLGFGLQPPAADWGLMVNQNQSGFAQQPLVIVIPALALGLFAVSVNLLADGVSRAFGQNLDRRELLS